MSDAVQLVADCGGELVTYTPHGGVAKQFKAIVDRQTSQVAALSGASYPENTILVAFPIDAIAGVLTIAKGQDKIRFKRNLSDGTETTFTVATIEEQNDALIPMWTVLVK